MTANQNPFCFKELKDLKWQMTKLHGMFTINNKCYLSIGVDANIVIGIFICIIIVMGANRLLNLKRKNCIYCEKHK